MKKIYKNIEEIEKVLERDLENYERKEEDKDDSINLKELFYVIRKKIKFILFITIVLTLAAGVISFYVLKPVYEAKSNIIIGKLNDDNKEIQYNQVLMYQNLIKTYSQIAKSRIVAHNAISKLNIDIKEEDLIESTTVAIQPDTQILNVSVRRGNPKEAVEITNALVYSFIEEAKIIFPLATIQIMDGAEFPKKPIKPNKMINIGVAFFLGIIISIGIIVLQEYLNSTLKTEEEVEKYLGLPIIGAIERYREN